MIAAALAATLAAASLSPAILPTNQADTLDAIRRVNLLLGTHYETSPRLAHFRGPRLGNTRDRYCDGGEGDLCHGGDPDRDYCPIDVLCHPNEDRLVEVLSEAATEYPASGYLMGQAVYALTKFGHPREAVELVNACEAEEWWCDALRGYVLHSMGHVTEAESLFREAMRGSPAPVMCSFRDALWLLGKWDQRTGGVEDLPDAREETSEWSCVDRLSASDTIWWWADPLYSVEGNDRWVEHIARAMSARFAAEIRRATRGADVPLRYLEHDWAMRVRRGPWDSFERLPGGSALRMWTSQENARYHFVPDVEPGALAKPTWRLLGGVQDEGYTPDYGPLFPIPVQLARFIAQDSLLIAVAGSLEDSPIERASSVTAYFFLTDGPGSLPLQLVADSSGETPVLLGQAAVRDYVASFEVVTRIGIGWHRQAVSPLAAHGPEVSDLLLYDPSERSEPDSLLAATASMLGSTTLERAARLGVFWETYGVPQGATLEFELRLERDTGRLVDRLTGLFPGGSQEARGRVAWTEPGSTGTHPSAISLDLNDLRSGEYALILTVQWPGQPVMERRREFRVD